MDNCNAIACTLRADEGLRLVGDFGDVEGNFCFAHAQQLLNLLNPSGVWRALLHPISISASDL